MNRPRRASAAKAKTPPPFSPEIAPGELSPCTVCPKHVDCTRFRQCKPWRAWVSISWNAVTSPLKRG